ncbi:MAG: hypothetical protein OEM59_20385, partial [Rhodospirillales bacterium]|nr:hypothetical protein [Rhodospirillales bacterium]
SLSSCDLVLGEEIDSPKTDHVSEMNSDYHVGTARAPKQSDLTLHALESHPANIRLWTRAAANLMIVDPDKFDIHMS